MVMDISALIVRMHFIY